MSQNADTIRQIGDAVIAFVHEELSNEALAERFDPQIEMIWQDRQTYPDFPQHLRGLGEVIAFLAQYRERWTDLVQEPLEMIEVPDGRVVALISQSARGRQSGVPIVIHSSSCSRSEMERCARSSTSVIGPTLSKPLGCRSRQCPRTSTSCARSTPLRW